MLFVLIARCDECVRQGTLFPLYDVGPAPHESRFDPSDKSASPKYFMYDEIYGVDPLLLSIPYKLHFNPFSELNSDETVQGAPSVYSFHCSHCSDFSSP
jgi:hypothetical protein